MDDSRLKYYILEYIKELNRKFIFPNALVLRTRLQVDIDRICAALKELESEKKIRNRSANPFTPFPERQWVLV